MYYCASALHNTYYGAVNNNNYIDICVYTVLLPALSVNTHVSVIHMFIVIFPRPTDLVILPLFYWACALLQYDRRNNICPKTSVMH